MNVILTGYMGTGKSSIGKLLAARLGCEFRDLDALIVTAAGASINDIFSLHGELRFRDLETSAIQELAGNDGLVVATGGGAVIRDENRFLLRQLGLVVNLTATPETILSRLEGESERPLLKDGKSLEKISGMLAGREQYYADADIRIDTTGKNVEDVLAEILCFLKGTARS